MRLPSRALLAVCLSAAALAGLAAADDPRGLVEADHWKRARAIVEPRVKANPNDAEAAAVLSAVRAKFGDKDAALELAERAVKLKPDVAWYHRQLAERLSDEAEKASIFRQLGLARRFRDETETAIKLDPGFVRARRDIIAFHVHAPGIAGGDKKKAEAMVDEIARIDPGAGFLARADLLRESKQTGDFESLYRQAMDAAKTLDLKYEAGVSLANWYFAQKPIKWDAAEAQSRTLIKLDPTRAAGHRALAIILATSDRWKDLDAALEAAEQAVPDNLTPYYRAAMTIFPQGTDNARAERYIRKYLSQEPEPGSATLANAHWRLGQVLEKEGKPAEAIAEIDQAVKMNGSLEAAKKDLARLRAAK